MVTLRTSGWIVKNHDSGWRCCFSALLFMPFLIRSEQFPLLCPHMHPTLQPSRTTIYKSLSPVGLSGLQSFNCTVLTALNTLPYLSLENSYSFCKTQLRSHLLKEVLHEYTHLSMHFYMEVPVSPNLLHLVCSNYSPSHTLS